MDSLDKHLADIINKIRIGRVVLFLGAGASKAAGGPTETELVNDIRGQFAKVDPAITSFIDTCQDFLEIPGYDRSQLENFVTQKLNLRPSKAHLIMAKYNWPAIFTTNYDELIEDSYRNDTEKKPFYTISYPSVTPTTDNSKIYIFKLMGTVKNRPENQMVLSRSDYNRMIAKKSEYLRDLRDFVQNGTIIFIGYGAADRIVTDIIDEVEERAGGIDKLPWSYILLKLDGQPLTDRQETRFRLRKMIPVDCSFEQFFQELEKNFSENIPQQMPLGNEMKIRIDGHDLPLNKKEVELLSEFYEIVNTELVSQEIGNKEDFFKGQIAKYPYYKADLDFRREIYTQEEIGIRARIFSELVKREKEDNRENKVIVITGPPGVGKSVLLRRLAYDVFSKEKAPVIFLDKTQSQPDYKLLANFLVQLDRDFDKTCGPGGGHRMRALLLIDDANALNTDPIFVKDYLASRGRLVTIVVAVRDNELADLKCTFPQQDIYRISESLSFNEKTDIIEYLFDKKFIESCDTSWDYILEKDYGSSFFATMYSLVRHTQKPLNEIIRDQYDCLSPMAKKAFSYVCAFNQFGLPINLELIVRAMKCSYEDFCTEILPETKGIIFEEFKQGFLLYAAHHRIIAKKTIDFFFGNLASQKELFLEVLSDINLKSIKERDLIQKLLIPHLGSERKSTDLSRKQKIEIFEQVCKQNGTKALLHHWGILLSDEAEFDHTYYDQAEEILKKALNTRDKQRSPFGSEMDQNVLTSIGNLYSRKGLTFLTNGKEAEADFEMRLAERQFLKARFGGFPNSYSYHAHANMYLQKGDLLKDETAKLNSYGTAMDILRAAKENLNDDTLQPILQLEEFLLMRIGKIEGIEEKAADIAKKYNSPSGYTLIASSIIRNSLTITQPEKKLNWALSLIEEALKLFPYDENCLRLKSQLIKRIKPDQEQLYFSILRDWFNNSKTPNVWLYFELAVMAFKFEEYVFSKEVFSKLEDERISGGLKRRFAEFVYRGKNDKPLLFSGVVTHIESKHDGEIRVQTLRNLPDHLHFRPIVCKPTQPAEDELVEFNIAFDYLGPRAINVKPQKRDTSQPFRLSFAP